MQQVARQPQLGEINWQNDKELVKERDMADTPDYTATTPMIVEEMEEIPEGTAPQHVALFDASGDPIAAGGSGEISDGSVTTAKIADDAVTAEKIAEGVIPDPYTLPAATAGAIGGVKQAAHVASAAGENVTADEFEALLDSLEAAGIVAAS